LVGQVLIALLRILLALKGLKLRHMMLDLRVRKTEKEPRGTNGLTLLLGHCERCV
jgi:hypothetical protein